MLNHLILVPTALERSSIDTARLRLDTNSTLMLCGLGPIVAAARATQLILQHQPQAVVLVGIAGAIGDALEVGAAYEFNEVASYGIGVGGGDNYQTIAELGWARWSSDSSEHDRVHAACPPMDQIGDCLQLDLPGSSEEHRQLLTVCAASANSHDVTLRQQKYPNAVAEDMEGFAVATACKLLGVPVRILRGISNKAGDRNKQHWQIAAAMNAAVGLLNQVLDP